MVETWGDSAARDWLEARGYRVYSYDYEVQRLCEYPHPYDRQANIIAVHHDRLDDVLRRLQSAPVPSLELPSVVWR